jgi:hypothetical protein
MGALLQRIGGIMITPRATLAPVIAGGPGGFNDLLLLLLLKAVALRMPQIARIGWQALDTGALGAGLLLVSVLAQAIMLPLIAALGGGLVLRFAAHGHAAAARRATDIASLCVVPAVALQLGTSLLAVPFPDLYQPWIRTAIRSAGGAWLVALLVLAIALLRRGTNDSQQDECPA